MSDTSRTDALRWQWARDRLSIEDIERMNSEVPIGARNIDEFESSGIDCAVDALLNSAKGEA